MITFALLCQKGGSGKSTLALHLAVEAATTGRRVLVLDLDPQASSARWADRRQADDVPAVDGRRKPGPAHGSPDASLSRGIRPRAAGHRPHADQASLQAARAADLVLIPVRCSILDLDAVGASLDLCALARRPAMVVLNAAPIRSRVVEEAAATIAKIGGTQASTIIRERVAFRHSLIDGRVAREFEPGGAAAREITALYVEACGRVNTLTTEAA
jgi:chromosome partitioning protein